jgi:hypothetical protein
MTMLRMIKFAATNGVGEIIVVVILEVYLSIMDTIFFCMNTHCMRNPSERICWLDQKRPPHPMISPVPASTTVGKSHHMRHLMACVMWATVHWVSIVVM